MQHVSHIERQIIAEILGSADDRALSVSVFDSEEWVLKKTRDFKAVRSVIGATEETTLRFRDHAGEVVGSVYLLHGNDIDVVGDYTDSPAMVALMASANAAIDRLAVIHG